MDKGVAM